jgi:hypothetical protein
MSEPNVLDGLPWEVRHIVDGAEHVAWYQRAALVGDFRPGVEPLAAYAVDGEGLAMDPTAPPRCVTCGEVPNTDALDVVNRDNGHRGYLNRYRREEKPAPWPEPTDPGSCWWCNCQPSLEPLVCSAPPICARCDAHLKKGL